MDTASILLILIIVLIGVAYIAGPYVSRREKTAASRGSRRLALRLRQHADLLAERNSIYQALTDLDFDFSTGKLSEGDYATQRYRLVAQGVEVLKNLDDFGEAAADDPVERALTRVGGDATAPPVPAKNGLTCPQCGAAIRESDRFCGACGHTLRQRASSEKSQTAP